MRTLDARAIPVAEAARALARSPAALEKPTAVAREVVAQVAREGDAALFALAERFDGVRPARLLLGRDALEEALLRLPRALADALRFAARQIEAFHRPQVPVGYEVSLGSVGSTAGQTPRALDRVGVYVPGGPAGYPSSVLMGVIPAKLAGVREVLVATPPSKVTGLPPDAVLAASSIAGADEVLVAGGAQAIAGMALGTESVRRVDKVVGPGNAYVTAAKLLLADRVGTDGIAGPSEVLVVADASLATEHLAAELLAQAEHDPDAVAIGVVVDDRDLGRVVEAAEARARSFPRSRQILESFARNGWLVKAPSVAYAVDLANLLAPEHVVLGVGQARAYAYAIRNAGCVFLGPSTTAPMGDYSAGTNHVLPTSGSARWRGGLSVRDFVKFVSFLEVREADAGPLAAPASEIARAEGFFAHADALASRVTSQEAVSR